MALGSWLLALALALALMVQGSNNGTMFVCSCSLVTSYLKGRTTFVVPNCMLALLRQKCVEFHQVQNITW